MYKFHPKYYLKLSDANTPVMMAETVKAATLQFTIKIDSPHIGFIAKGKENVMTRLRGNFGKNQFFLFDGGINQKEVKPGQKLAVNQHIRRQQGTILYSKKRANGQ